MDMPARIRRTPSGVVLWTVATALYLLGLLAERLLYSSTTSCELSSGDSIYGEPGWSWIPVGHTCTWEDVGEGLTFVDGPSMMTLAPVMVLALWGISLLISGRSTKRSTQGSSRAQVP
jgi:hypothetical protein